MLETLKADADLVGGLETGIEASLVSADEQAILREFEDAEPAEMPPARAPAEQVPSPRAPEATRESQPEPAPRRRAEKAAEEPESDEREDRGRARRAEPS
jgi:hypothetical protein